MLVRHHRGIASGSDPAWGQGSRGIIAGGGTPWTSKIEYITIATPANAAIFGTIHTAGPNSWDGCSNLSGTAGDGRGFILSGHDGTSPWSDNDIRYLTIATTGNSATFGILTRGSGRAAATSNGKRALFFGGYGVSTTFSDSIDYFAMATLGNASVYGTITSGEAGYTAATGDGTYGMVGKGYNNGWGQNTWVDYCSIDTTGNTTLFGGAFVGWQQNTALMTSGAFACSNGVRAFYGGGYQQENQFGNPDMWSSIEHWTFAVPTTNSLEYGHLNLSTDNAPGLSDGSRAVIAGRGDYNATNILYFDMNASGTGNTTATFGNIYDPGNGRGSCAGFAGD